jgi:hypothetical protein
MWYVCIHMQEFRTLRIIDHANIACLIFSQTQCKYAKKVTAPVLEVALLYLIPA